MTIGDLLIGEDPIGEGPTGEAIKGDTLSLNGGVLKGGVALCGEPIPLSSPYVPMGPSSSLLRNNSPIRDDLGWCGIPGYTNSQQCQFLAMEHYLPYPLWMVFCSRLGRA